MGCEGYRDQLPSKQRRRTLTVGGVVSVCCDSTGASEAMIDVLEFGRSTTHARIVKRDPLQIAAKQRGTPLKPSWLY